MAAAAESPMFFRQLFDRETCTYTYVLADGDTKEAVIIDPVFELVDRDMQLIEEWGLTLKYVLNTHVHADHVTGSGAMKKRCDVKSVIGSTTGAKADVHLAHGESVEFGRHSLTARATPGHTGGCHCFVLGDESMVFTGDTLLIRGCGRTDFQSGSSETLYASVHEQLFTLPDSCRVFPAHDYKGRTESTIGEEKAYNPRLTKDLETFKKIMEDLDLAYPKRIDVSLPLNMMCGLHELVEAEKEEAAAAVEASA
eukprot:PLAT11963.1.p2 GENE.PLAT11963.1~~PLAT11963.1.p2  ORF type:complete len:254 (+),score=105.26 PLAT11963.1:69-830(+)